MSTINDIVKKFNQRNNKQILLRGGTQFQDSKYDETYKNLKFKKFYDESYDTPWSKAETYQKLMRRSLKDNKNTIKLHFKY